MRIIHIHQKSIMKKSIIAILPILFHLGVIAQQTTKESIVKPFKIEESILSGMDIPKLKLDDHPEREYFQKRIYAGSELSIFILSSETALNEIKDFPIDEFVYYINGRADIITSDNESLSFYSGDYLFVPKGFSGNWTNNGGNTFHLELSVITNKRSDSTLTPKAKKPFLLDRELLSGIGLTKVDSIHYRDLIYSGLELDVITESSKPSIRNIPYLEKEILIHVLNGIVTIKPDRDEVYTFYKGDFFVLPKGFKGSWKSKGQSLSRVLKVIPK